MKENVDDLKNKLKQFEAEMQKLERSLTNDTPSTTLKEKIALKTELEGRLEILRTEEQGKDLKKQLERDIKSFNEGAK